MRKRRSTGARYVVELVLGGKRTGMLLPRNTGNWFTYRIFDGPDEIGTVEVGRGSIFWRPYRHKRRGTSYRRSWRRFAELMEHRTSA